MLKSIRVLIAEDELLVVEMIQGLLEELGHTVVGKAANGKQAVALIHELGPDAVLMDFDMPEMNGLEAARRITDSRPTPVVLLTAYETPEMIAQAGSAGVGAYLTKPTNALEMDRALTIAVARFEDLMELRRMNAKLKEALFAFRTLSGMLPICASCKKIRNEKGQWQHIEEYISNHSEAEFTHSICPLCAHTLYGDIIKD
jgi:AmiR/NasT family two-component response regulator